MAASEPSKRASIGAVSSSVMSTGRGGAGNIGSDKETAPATAKDLQTPHIKNEHYTTGRGGTGNMAYNHPAAPEMARASQDVVTPPVRTEAQRGSSYYGRGGSGNTARADAPATVVGVSSAGEEARGREKKERRPSQSIVDNAKQMLNRLRSSSGRRDSK